MRLRHRSGYGRKLSLGEYRLTSKEDQVMRMRMAGIKREQIASVMGITVHGVDFHIARVYRRLGVNCIQEATRILAKAAA